MASIGRRRIEHTFYMQIANLNLLTGFIHVTELDSETSRLLLDDTLLEVRLDMTRLQFSPLQVDAVTPFPGLAPTTVSLLLLVSLMSVSGCGSSMSKQNQSGSTQPPTAPIATPVPTATPITVTPAILSGGPITLSISGSGFTASSIVMLDGKQLKTQVSSASTLIATGYLPPWRTGSSAIAIASASGGPTTSNISIPIAQTVVPYDTAARFATQAAFGPRHDVVEHIQQVGLDAFITEQMQQPPLTYSTAPGNTPRRTFLLGAITGNSLLRQRVSWALQSFVVNSGLFQQQTVIPWEQAMEIDATGNFRQVLQDTASNTLMGVFLNEIGNSWSSNPDIHPNQNFAREFLQLFSIGPSLLNDDGTLQLDSTGNPIAAYDQSTIIDLSRALTGWWYAMPAITPDMTFSGIDYSQPMAPLARTHDPGQKTLFGTVVLPAGQDAATDRQMALDAVFNHPNVPPFVSRILIQRLVKSSPSSEYVGRISKVFKDDGNGVRGNLAAVVRAILLDPEARAGDTNPAADDGFLQEPLFAEIYTMSLLQDSTIDDQPTSMPDHLGEPWMFSPLVFGFYSPSYVIPGTNINSPEFGLFNNLTAIQRSTYLWAMVEGGVNGFRRQPTNYLYSNFTTVPDMVDALNHLLYHGQMPAATQTTIINYCTGLNANNPSMQLDTAIFLALNGAAYQVSQ